MFGQLLVVVTMLAASPGEDAAPAGDQHSQADRAAYEAARKAAGGDAQAQVRLALWCQAHGMAAESMKHLAAAVLNDPSNALARSLMGLVSYNGKWERPDDVSRAAKDDPKRQALLQEYLDRRAKAPDKADDQWKLAQWCEQNGLKDQAVAHYHAVLRLDPKREAAWKHLGFKKSGGRWVKPEWQEAAKREADEQDRASKRWKPILERYRSGLSSRERARRQQAEAGLLDVTDPRAAPMVWTVFAARGASDQKIAVTVFGQIDSPGSSRALTVLALKSSSPEARQHAIQILRGRDPRDFAPLLIRLLRNKVKYQVRRVNGPGTTGELLIQNKELNIDRRYSPPPMPFIPLQPGDSLIMDQFGLPEIQRFLGQSVGPGEWVPGNNPANAAAMFGLSQPANNSFSNVGLPPAIAGKLNALQAQASQVPIAVLPGGNPNWKYKASEVYNSYEFIPVGLMMFEAQQAAAVAEKQLEGDVQAIDAYNLSVESSNQAVLQVLTGATGTDFGGDPTAWYKWIVDLAGYAASSQSSSSTETPTVVEQVPLLYQPQPVPVINITQLAGVEVQRTHSCFAAGTPVRTFAGLRAIETLRPGDLVLTEDPREGGLKYRAVVIAYHNPPNATHRVTLDSGDSIVATGIHRLWKAGQGWTMTRDLKPGDVLRTLGGVVAVKSVAAEKTQPVYNLRVADGESYFVGIIGVLAHDNSTINPVPEPFDAVSPLKAGSAAHQPAKSMLGR
jgi:hypothetical protein